MVAARACAGLVSTAHQLRSEPDNAYLHDNLAVDRAVFEMVAALPLELGTLAMRRAAGLLGAPDPALAGRAPRSSPDLGAVTAIDLSTTSPLLDEGAWTDPARVRAAVRSAVGLARSPAPVSSRTASRTCTTAASTASRSRRPSTSASTSCSPGAARSSPRGRAA